MHLELQWSKGKLNLNLETVKYPIYMLQEGHTTCFYFNTSTFVNNKRAYVSVYVGISVCVCVHLKSETNSTYDARP